MTSTHVEFEQDFASTTLALGDAAGDGKTDMVDLVGLDKGNLSVVRPGSGAAVEAESALSAAAEDF